MIWYLTYPVRRTVNPPILSPGHPIHDVVENYAYSVAANPASIILLSVTIGLITCFLSFLNHASGSAMGALALPGHMWTSTRALELQNLADPPDFTIKQAWVHGRPMGALGHDVLRQVLIIQNILLGVEGDRHAVTTRNDLSSTGQVIKELPAHSVVKESPAKLVGPVIHTPLQYWNNSLSKLDDEQDIASTINRKSSHLSPFNITLRQPSLFAGKKYSKEGKLVAADAAILSFMFPYGSTDSDLWSQRAELLAKSDRWDVFLPHDGQSIRAYEFRLSILSRKDDVFLVFAYVVMLTRIVFSLRQVQAIRSRYVLLPGIMLQNTLSIMSTFAIMSLVGMDYSQIPLEAYVFIVSMIGFDNALQLINAVLEAPAEKSTNERVARALGSISIHMLSPVERTVFLWLLSKVVSPLVASYCTFIAIAHGFDMFYHLAFFVPVLCIDLQRLELQESIARQRPVSTSRSPILSNSKAPHAGVWNRLPPVRDAKPQANIRIAGTAVMIFFLLALDWQCCSNQTIPRLFRRALASLRSKSTGPNASTDFWSELVKTVRPSRSLTSWLYLQNQETAKEILRVMKPGSREFEAVIYDPMVIVLKGSHRSGSIWEGGIPSMSIETLALSQLIVSTILVVGGIVAAWMLLRAWVPGQLQRGLLSGSCLTAVSFQEHDMDIVFMAASSSGILVTISLDREVFLWQQHSSYSLIPTHSFILDDEFWPVVATSVSDDSKWVTFCNSKGSVNFWNVTKHKFETPVTTRPPFSQTAKFFYVSDEKKAGSTYLPRLVIVRPSGWLSEVTAKGRDPVHHRIGSAGVLSSIRLDSSQPGVSILSISKDNNIYLTSKIGPTWSSRSIEIERLPTASLSNATMATFPGLGALCIILSPSAKLACFVHAHNHTVLHSFRILNFVANSARGLFASSHTCNRCGATSVSSIALAYTDPDTKSLIMHTFARSRDNGIDKICLGGVQSQDTSRPCPAFETAHEQLHAIEDVRSWEQLDSCTLTGIREKSKLQPPAFGLTSRILKPRRNKASHQISEFSSSLDDHWEAWLMSIAGQSMSCQVDRSGQRSKLAVSTVGPAEKIGQRSVAVAFGNSVIILSAGEEDKSKLHGRNVYG